MYLLAQADGYQYPGREEVYVLDTIRLGAGLAAISSDQSLCIFDPERLGQGPLKRIQTSHGNLTTAKAYNDSESIVCTTGESGSISLWDLRLDPSQAQALQLQGVSVVSKSYRYTSSPNQTALTWTAMGGKRQPVQPTFSGLCQHK